MMMVNSIHEVVCSRKKCLPDASFETFTAVIFQVEVFWAVAPCSVVVGYQRFRGPCCLHLHIEEIVL